MGVKLVSDIKGKAYGLRLFENRALRILSGSKMEEMTRG
jgi:hypothetical protein